MRAAVGLELAQHPLVGRGEAGPRLEARTPPEVALHAAAAEAEEDGGEAAVEAEQEAGEARQPGGGRGLQGLQRPGRGVRGPGGRRGRDDDRGDGGGAALVPVQRLQPRQLRPHAGAAAQPRPRHPQLLLGAVQGRGRGGLGAGGVAADPDGVGVGGAEDGGVAGGEGGEGGEVQQQQARHRRHLLAAAHGRHLRAEAALRQPPGGGRGQEVELGGGLSLSL